MKRYERNTNMANKTAYLDKRRKEHWRMMEIRNEINLKKEIDAIFEKHTDQANALIDIYRLILPDWDNIESVSRFPTAGKKLSLYITKQFITFDQKHHPSVMNGDMWINNGWSMSESIAPWDVSFDSCHVAFINHPILKAA
jgi:hypothetical protein